MVCNFTGHKASACKTAKNKQNLGSWPQNEPAVWPPRVSQSGQQPQNARAPLTPLSQQQPTQAGSVATVTAHCVGYQPSSWTSFV